MAMTYLAACLTERVVDTESSLAGKFGNCLRRAGRSDLPAAMTLGSLLGLLVAAAIRGLLESSDVSWAGTDHDVVGLAWFLCGTVLGAAAALGFTLGIRRPQGRIEPRSGEGKVQVCADAARAFWDRHPRRASRTDRR